MQHAHSFFLFFKSFKEFNFSLSSGKPWYFIPFNSVFILMQDSILVIASPILPIFSWFKANSL